MFQKLIYTGYLNASEISFKNWECYEKKNVPIKVISVYKETF